MNEEKNKMIVKKFIKEFWNQRNQTLRAETLHRPPTKLRFTKSVLAKIIVVSI